MLLWLSNLDGVWKYALLDLFALFYFYVRWASPEAQQSDLSYDFNVELFSDHGLLRLSIRHVAICADDLLFPCVGISTRFKHFV